MAALDLQARAREIAAGLPSLQARALVVAFAASSNTYKALRRRGLCGLGVKHTRAYGFALALTDLGRAVAAVLAEGGGK
jgi:hypothetical protein